MISTGAWNWNPKKPKHVEAMVSYNKAMIKLNDLYPQADNDDSGFNELFDAPAKDDVLSAKLKKQKLVDLLKKTDDIKTDYPVPTKEDVMPKLSANDIIDRIRSKNSRTQQIMVFNSLLNQLTSVADLISEQEQHFDIWEMRDLEWHLNSVKNRIYWLLQQREDI